MLGENCPVATPTPEGSDMSCSERNETPQNPPSADCQQESQAGEERGDECSSAESSGDGSSSGSSSGSEDGDDSELVPSVPETLLQKPVATAPQKDPANRTKSTITNQRTVRHLRTLRSMDQRFTIYRNDRRFLEEVSLDLKFKDYRYTVKLLAWAGELLYHKLRDETYAKTLCMYTRRYTLDKELDPGPTPAEFDDMLYHLADEAWTFIIKH